jgi:hypothetical protein
VGFAVVAVVGIWASAGGSDCSALAAPEPAPANFVVHSKGSWAFAIGVADAWTGDGKIKFYVVVRNTGDEAGTFSFTPVRHYTGGETTNRRWT